MDDAAEGAAARLAATGWLRLLIRGRRFRQRTVRSRAQARSPGPRLSQTGSFPWRPEGEPYHCHRETASGASNSLRPFQRIAAHSRRIVNPILCLPNETSADLVGVFLSAFYEKPKSPHTPKWSESFGFSPLEYLGQTLMPLGVRVRSGV